MRAFEEIREDIRRATSISDSEAVLRYAAELDELDEPMSLALATGARGVAYRLRADYPKALEYSNRALALFEELDAHGAVATVLVNIGNVHKEIGDYPATLEYYHRAQALYEELGDRSGVAITTGNIGNVYGQTGDYPASLEHYHRALALHTELGDRGGVARVTGNIGNVHNNTGDFPVALEHYYRALALYQELGDRGGEATVTVNIGNVHSKTGDHRSSLEHCQRAVTLFEEAGERGSVAFAQGHVVGAYLDMGFDSEAQALLATMDAKQIDEPDVRIHRRQLHATLQERSGDLEGAVSTLCNALNEAREHGLRAYSADLHKELRELAQKRNDFASYIEHNTELTRITEEIRGKDTATKLAIQEATRTMAKERTEREREQAVLYSTLPKHIAERVIRGEVVNDHIDNAAVMFLDIVGFTTLSSTLTSQQVITLLDEVFRICDEVCNANGVTRIKTIGDSYLAVAMPSLVPRDDNSLVSSSRSESLQDASGIAIAALQIIDRITTTEFMSLLVASPEVASRGVAVRIGLHCGPVTAGVIGTERLQYDVWGDTVNVASRMESTSEPNRIHVSQQFKDALENVTPRNDGVDLLLGTWHLALRGETSVKGKGTMTTYWLEHIAS